MDRARAIREALRLRAELGIRGVASGADVDRAVAAAGVERWPDEPMPSPLYGLYAGGVMSVREGLLPDTAVAVVAHELGHAVLGHGSGRYLAPLAYGDAPADPLEQEAQVFAYALLVGAPAPTPAGLDEQLYAAGQAGVAFGLLVEAASILVRDLGARLLLLAAAAAIQGPFGQQLPY